MTEFMSVIRTQETWDRWGFYLLPRLWLQKKKQKKRKKKARTKAGYFPALHPGDVLVGDQAFQQRHDQ
jgi:hypothetical protein